MAQMISEAVNRYAAGCLASGFSAIPYLTAKKQKYDFHENGERAGNLLPNREALAGYRGAALTRGSKGMKPFARTPIRDRARSVLYIHRVALLPLNLRTVSPIYGETSMRVAFIFGFINSDLKAS